MIVVKAIKPDKLKDRAIFDALERAAETAANDILLDFEATTATWEHQVKFEKIVAVGPASIDVLVGTDDEIYGYVNNGTRPHAIRAKNAKVLAFPSAFTPKTTPGKLTAGRGGSGGPTVFAAEVQHPGTEARDFDKAIQKDWKPKFKRLMEQGLKAGAAASGHGIE